MKATSGRTILLYHFFHPDDVISARLFSDIAEEVARDGGSVVAMPSVRSCHDGEAGYVKNEEWKGVEIRRVWRPDWRQGSNKGRVGNALCMLLGWSWRAIWTRRSKNETVVIGTDPPLSVLVAIPWRLFRPRARIVHWCHDLYPQAAIAEGIFKADSWSVKVLNALLRVAYARCDVIADLGACMRAEILAACGERPEGSGTSPSPLTPLPVTGRGEKSFNSSVTGRGEKSFNSFETGRGETSFNSSVTGRGETSLQSSVTGQGETSLHSSGTGGGEKNLDSEPLTASAREGKSSQSEPLTVTGRGETKSGHGLGEKYVTLTPWALVEPEQVLEADEAVRRELFGDAKLGLLYSGNLGRAHVYEPFFELARRVAGDSIAFCYAGRGAGIERLEARVREVGSNENESPSPPTPLPRVLGRGEVREPAELGVGRVGTEGGERPSPPTPLPVTGRGEPRGPREALGGVLRIRFAGFASEEELAKRLGAADVHMVSLAPNWTGTVVPSKFFGALAVGRPVLFAGSRRSAIARWIDEFRVGWVLDEAASIALVAEELRAFAANPAQVQAMREHCFAVYQREFSKAVQLEKWKGILSG